MPVITVINQNRIIPCPTGSNLMKILRDAGVFLEAPCSGLAPVENAECRLFLEKFPIPHRMKNDIYLQMTLPVEFGFPVWFR